MEQRLAPINTVIALCTRGDVNRALLADAGFELVGLEVPVLGAAGKVTVDVVLAHTESGHLVLCEAKSGANVEAAQARAYAQLDPEAVVQAASVTLRTRERPTVEVVYVCLAEHADRIQLGLVAAELACPVLSVGMRSVQLLNGEAATAALRAAFGRSGSGTSAVLELEAPVMAVIAFDHESPAEAVEPAVRAELVAATAQRVSQITTRALTERAAPHYAIYGKGAQTQLRKRVTEAARRIAEADVTGTWRFEPPTATRSEPIIWIDKTPETYDARGRTQAYQALGRVRDTRRRTREPIEGQLDLLSELVTADDASDNEDAATDPREEKGAGDDHAS